MIKTRALPLLLAVVLSVCLNTAPFSLAVHAAEESRPANTENEISADVIGCQNTDEPETASAAEESAPASSEDEPEPAETYEIETVYDLNPAESEQAAVTEGPGAVESETSGDGEDTDLTRSEPGSATGETESAGFEPDNSTVETESAGPETGVTAEEPDSAESDAEDMITFMAKTAKTSDIDVTAGTTETFGTSNTFGTSKTSGASKTSGTSKTSGEASDEHHLAFASDYHNTDGSIRNAFAGMPEDVEFVGMVGDMVGEMGNMRPAYDSQMILDLVREVFPDLDNTNISIIWADHDTNVNDNAGIVKCVGGTGSGQIFAGTNTDSSPAYYIYAIGHYDMTEGDGRSTEAAAAFKTWVRELDHTIPVIVLCHVPLQAIRGDNKGASYWNEALNYAATGVEGITSTDMTADIIRNVLYLNGHNHTVDPVEYYFGAGSTMNVQVDNSDDQSGPSISPGGEFPPFNPGGTGGQRPPFRPGRKPEGVLSNIYYTSLTAGYLKTSEAATLVTVSNGALTLMKTSGGQIVSLGTNGFTGALVDSVVNISAQQHIHGEDVTENLVAATCNHQGGFDVAVYCTVCGKELYRSHFITGTSGHSWNKWSTVRKATETEEGDEVRACSVCGLTEHRSIPRLQPQNTEKPSNIKNPEYTADQDRTEDAGSTEQIRSTVSPLTADESQWMAWLVILGLSLSALSAVTVSAGKQ